MKVTEDFISISERPKIVQPDGQPVSAETAEYIYKGELCAFDGEQYAALKKHIRRRRFVYIVITVFIAACGAAFAAGAFLGGAPRSFKEMRNFVFILAVGIAFIAVAVLVGRLYNKDTTALKAAERGNIRYKYHNKLRYEYKDAEKDTRYDYYADLGDFAVNIPQAAAYAPYAVGAVISVDDNDCFYLIV